MSKRKKIVSWLMAATFALSPMTAQGLLAEESDVIDGHRSMTFKYEGVSELDEIADEDKGVIGEAFDMNFVDDPDDANSRTDEPDRTKREAIITTDWANSDFTKEEINFVEIRAIPFHRDENDKLVADMDSATSYVYGVVKDDTGTHVYDELSRNDTIPLFDSVLEKPADDAVHVTLKDVFAFDNDNSRPLELYLRNNYVLNIMYPKIPSKLYTGYSSMSPYKSAICL